VHLIIIVVIVAICWGSILFYRLVERPLIKWLNRRSRLTPQKLTDASEI
jgi:peptidoglycan/LPS O-acetylase OafA/YrhL